ncbi:MAG TPA: ROK family transcriptional regulator [Aliidongia sp.]|nr:ROK family transcriptional regulator [Aliidongia sp.]
MDAMQTGDTELIRAINRFHVLDTIRRFEPISRAEVGERTQLSRTTVSAIITALLDEGVIYYDEGEPSASQSKASAARGRPRVLLRINPNAAYVVGVKLSMHQMSITVTNLRADPLSSLVLPVRTWRLGAALIADLLEDGIRAAVAKAGITMGQIAGVGVGLPGFIDSVAGISHWSPILAAEPTPVPFAKMLSDRLGVSAVIENDANLVTLAERWFGHAQNVDNFVVVTVEAGIGMGLFINGELYRGHHGMGTEFGHSKIDRQGPLCRCGQHGCIEAFAADYAILREARKIVDLPPTEDEPSIEAAVREITRRARDGHEGLRAVFAAAGEILGLGIANLVNVIDPGKVIISGAGMRAADLLEPSVRAAVAASSLRVLNGRCEIIFHDWTDEVWARGAASLVLQGLYRVPWSRNARIEMAI